jgi:uncharacterized protein YjbI with pentapeptide repeats
MQKSRVTATAVILSGSHLFGADFSAKSLSGATFSWAKLAYAVFGGMHAEQTSFVDAHLRCAFSSEHTCSRHG